MDNLELLKRRLTVHGGDAEGRIRKDKLKSLEQALKYSYQAETVMKDGETFRALMVTNKLKPDYDDKIMSIPYYAQFKVGDLFFWERTNSYWIIYLQHHSEDAYFRGYTRRAEQTMRWKDEYGNMHETHVAARGPVETKVRSQSKSGIVFDEPNYTLALLVPSNEDTIKLKRYSKVTIKEQNWEVVATDSISEEGIIEINLIESYMNKEEDTKEVVGGKIEKDIIVLSCLDDITESLVGAPIDVWSQVKVDGQISSELNENATYEILEGLAHFDSKQLTIDSNTKVKIRLSIPKINFEKEFTIQGIDEIVNDIVDINIIGNSSVKSYGTAKYIIQKYKNGAKEIATGEWEVPHSNLFTIESANSEELILKWNVGRVGSFELKYKDEDDIVSKFVEVESLL